MTDGFSIQYAGTTMGEEALRQQTEVVANAIETLATQMMSVKSQNLGFTAEDFDAAIARWRLNVEDMRTLLNSGQLALGDIAQNYDYTDRREAASWQALQ
ncbi:WXG100 family type VII secretion target [Marinactinospora rubrisoli]|uniref:WXG100 family type VII secretion target n=1 Tax=Marinactinospora rubrisoli TaxID=2715399 RepID=A0ABW2KA05_9ACTN